MHPRLLLALSLLLAACAEDPPSIRARGLIPRTMFASDGPQSSGAVRSYLARIRDGMETAGFDADEIAAVLGGNFTRLFLAPLEP